MTALGRKQTFFVLPGINPQKSRTKAALKMSAIGQQRTFSNAANHRLQMKRSGICSPSEFVLLGLVSVDSYYDLTLGLLTSSFYA
jgi:hypothetical protein